MKRVYEKIKPESNSIVRVRNAIQEIFPDHSDLKEWYDNYASNHTHRFAFDLQYLEDEYPDPKDIKILELGSIPPILTHLAQQGGYEITGLDVAPDRFSKCIKNQNLSIIQHTLGEKELPFEDDTFDLILMNEIFEHLNTNLITLMTDLKRVLKPGGKLFISTPNLRSIIGIRNFLFKGKAYSCSAEIYDEYDKISQYGHMGHVREYTPVEVSTFLQKIGYTIESILYRGRYPSKYRWIDILFPRLKPYFSLIVRKE